MSLAWNQLTGTIPIELVALTRLTNLFLNNNLLTGTIVNELATLSHLATLCKHHDNEDLSQTCASADYVKTAD
eukprot:CAMPEP_0114306044 /NCGR_PEP_ID=MMETSP0059-20121206/16672_1 /TAXON_ID=36894 /ORGANISM="Pyramimonas parkeae, Strain CCMP726" /LENGTH=72 /DNA_ID=CAMNT_0001429307 /DNA_START=1252 /DNA_END=1470 /DNA_ORIENTATION=-